jgi:ectoine hydroxylase-related dioxygenase (phytanoyl-CoA dioxygenase family)
MIPNQIYNLTSLQTDGYTVIPNFLSIDEIEHFREDYRNQKDLALVNGIDNKNYKILPGSKHFLEDKISNVLIQLANQTDLVVDLIMPNTQYWDTTLAGLGFHCDHEPYFYWQNLYNSLNFWIPIIKPVPTELGLVVIPFSKLLELIPEITKEHIISKGSKIFIKNNDSSITMRDYQTGKSHVLNINFEEIQVVPEVTAGDLLLVRGDCIHRTQSRLGHRVALSIRCANSNTILKKDQFISGPGFKHRFIQNNPKEWSRILSNFGNANEVVLGKLYPTGHLIKL